MKNDNLNEKLQNNGKRSKPLDVKRLVGMTMFASLAYGVTFVFRIPVSVLTFDAKDAILTIAAFIYGPVSAIIMSFIPAFIEFITISGTGPWGFLMNFLSSACFSFTASLIYKYRRTFNGAIVALYVSVIATTLFMIPMNIIVMPLYKGVPREAVIKLLPTLVIPFNFAKCLMNAALTMLIYKPVSQALKKAKLVSGGFDLRFNKRSTCLLIIALLSAAVAVAVFIITKNINA